MRWGKIVLLFQAVITLVIGAVFFFQLLEINDFSETGLENGANSEEGGQINLHPALSDIRQKYSIAAYALLMVSIIEILVIYRLVS